MEPLLKREFITRQVRRRVTSAKSLEATVQAASQLEQAKIQLDYTRIHAPSPAAPPVECPCGQPRERLAGVGAPLVTINSTDPVLATFSIPSAARRDPPRPGQGEMRIEILADRSGPAVAEASSCSSTTP